MFPVGLVRGQRERKLPVAILLQYAVVKGQFVRLFGGYTLVTDPDIFAECILPQT